MKHLFKPFFCLLALFCCLSSARADWRNGYKETLFAVERNGKWGFIDAQGKIKIPLQFKAAHPFSEGLAAVEIGDKYGFIDQSGKIAVAPRFKYAFDFREGLAWIQSNDEAEGFIDKTGKVVLQAPNGFYCREFRDGLAQALPLEPPYIPGHTPQARKIGFIDKSGNWAIQPAYRAAWDFSEGLASVILQSGDRKTLRWGCIDKTGKIVIAARSDDPIVFGEGIAVASDDGKKFFIDQTGRRIFPQTFQDAQGFREGLAAVEIGGKWGFIDKRGALKIKPKLERCDSFFNGRAAFQVGHDSGYIDKTGYVVVAPRYELANFFLGELASVSLGSSSSDGSGNGYINRAGKVIWAPLPKIETPQIKP